MKFRVVRFLDRQKSSENEFKKEHIFFPPPICTTKNLISLGCRLKAGTL